MQIDLVLRANKEVRLPLNYNYMLQSSLYNFLRVTEEGSHLHDTAFKVDNRHFRLFTFSRLKGASRIEGKDIIFKDKIYLSVRTVNQKVYQAFLAAHRISPLMRLGRNQLTVEKIDTSEGKRLDRDSYQIRMLTPIIVRSTDPISKRTYFYSPLDGEFETRLVANAERKFRSFYGNDKDFSLAIRSLGVLGKDKVVTSYKGYYLTAWMGQFEIVGNPEVLDFLYHVGLGEKNTMGFGMFEIEERISHER